MAHAVDLDLLAHTCDSLAAVGGRLGALLDDVRARNRALHLAWGGQAATAAAEAEQRWESAFVAMGEALGAMRAAGRTAYGNYAEAADLNTRMWEQLR